MVTVNELMVLMKAVRGRIGQLQELQKNCSKKESFFMRDENKVVEPKYDVKAVDRKITELQNFIFRADAKIKQSNAITQIDIDINVDSLLQPLE